MFLNMHKYDIVNQAQLTLTILQNLIYTKLFLSDTSELITGNGFSHRYIANIIKIRPTKFTTVVVRLIISLMLLS